MNGNHDNSVSNYNENVQNNTLVKKQNHINNTNSKEKTSYAQVAKNHNQKLATSSDKKHKRKELLSESWQQQLTIKTNQKLSGKLRQQNCTFYVGVINPGP